MAVTEIKGALRTVAEKVSQFVSDAAVLKVETRTLEAGSTQESVLAARTVISLDGDNLSEVPASKNAEGKWEIDTVLYDLHMRNVEAAIAYRSRMMASMLDLLGSGSGMRTAGS
ncbi:hypothetical protein [Paraliomyxa miuraensis]|uniref:hypothetical protein n=1 Tax=Paraliomyxa miuraensis TaxID=376150 RepID=UPI0022508753|nr:hypothetical protein [Paraliomyxa miuraensis]MCX4245232.1 hypothetical protein [Paraliomyxa miuraensis]